MGGRTEARGDTLHARVGRDEELDPGGHELALACADRIGEPHELRALVARSEERFGVINLFCSNAGIAVGAGLGDGAGGPFASDADWRRNWEVNVMAHVYAARAVLPGMLARGEGWLLQTASAAGLLTDLLAQAYSVTKHAAVGFAEWLAIAYGERAALPAAG